MIYLNLSANFSIRQFKLKLVTDLILLSKAMALEQLLIELATDSNQILNSKGLASVAIQSSVNTLSVALQNRLKMNSITSTIDTEKHWLNVFWSIPVSQHCVPMLRSALRYLINILCQKSENTLITLLRDRKLASDIECRSQHSFGFVSGFEALHVRLCLTSFGLKNLELVITLLFDHLSFVCRKYPNWSHYQEQCRSSLLQMFLKNLNHVHCESYTQIAVELHKGLVVPNILYMCNFMLPDRVTLLKHMEQFGHLQKYLAPKYARFILQSNQEFTSSAFFHPISTVHCPIRRRPLDLINLLSRHISKLCTSDQKGMYEWTLLPSNPFLPTNIKVLLCPGQPDRVRLINQKPSGRLWYRCTQYLLMPLGSIHVRLSGALPSNVNDARLAAAADLLTLMLQTRIDQNLENARQTGFTFTVNVQPHQTMLIIFGYSQNMRTALIALLQQLQMREFDLNANLERLGLLYLQTVQSQAGYLCDLVKHTLFAGQPRIVNRHRELMKIDRSHVNLIYNYLFKHMQIECLVEGNFLQSDAEAFFHLLYENFPHLGSPSHQLAYQSCDWNQPALKVRVPGSGIYIFARHSASDSPSSASVNSDTIIESSSLMEELMPNAKNMIKDRNLNPGFTSTPSKRLFHCDPTIELNMPPFKRARYSTTSHTSMGSLLSMNSFISLCSDMTCTDNASDTFAESPDDGPLCGPVQPRTHILCNVFLFYFERVLIKGTTIDPLHQHLLVLMMISYVRSLSAEFFSEVLKPNLTKFYDLLESAQISIPMIEVRRAFDDVDAFDIEVDVQPLHLGVKSAFVLTLQDGNSQMSLFRLRMIMNAFLEFACLSTRDLSADRFAQIRQYALDELDRKPKFYEEVRDHWTHLMCGSLDVPAKEDYLQSIKKLRRFDFIQFANGVFCFTPGFRMLSFQLDADASTDLSQRNQGETEFSHETFAALTAPYVPSIAILDSDEYNEYIQSTPTRYPTKWVEAYRSKQ